MEIHYPSEGHRKDVTRALEVIKDPPNNPLLVEVSSRLLCAIRDLNTLRVLQKMMLCDDSFSRAIRSPLLKERVSILTQ